MVGWHWSGKQVIANVQRSERINGVIPHFEQNGGNASGQLVAVQVQRCQGVLHRSPKKITVWYISLQVVVVEVATRWRKEMKKGKKEGQKENMMESTNKGNQRGEEEGLSNVGWGDAPDQTND